MKQPGRKLKMKTIMTEFNGKESIVGVLGKSNLQRRYSLVKVLRKLHKTNRRYGTHLKLASNILMDQILTDPRYWKKISSVFPCIVGACIAYGRTGKKLGSEIILEEESEPRLVLPVGKYEGEKRLGLAIPDLKIGEVRKEGKDLVIDVPDTRFIPIPGFSQSGGTHQVHAQTGIPHMKRRGVKRGGRSLWRTKKPFIGFPIRYAEDDCGDNTKVIDACFPIIPTIGIPVEVPAEDISKIEPCPENADPFSLFRKGNKIVIEGSSEQLDGIFAMLSKIR